MKLFYSIVSGLVSIVVPTMSVGQLPQRELQGPRFFYASKNSVSLRAVRENMEKRISFNGRFSQSLYLAALLAERISSSAGGMAALSRFQKVICLMSRYGTLRPSLTAMS